VATKMTLEDLTVETLGEKLWNSSEAFYNEEATDEVTREKNR
jgi:hypothetical protein